MADDGECRVVALTSAQAAGSGLVVTEKKVNAHLSELHLWTSDGSDGSAINLVLAETDGKTQLLLHPRHWLAVSTTPENVAVLATGTPFGTLVEFNLRVHDDKTVSFDSDDGCSLAAAGEGLGARLLFEATADTPTQRWVLRDTATEKASALKRRKPVVEDVHDEDARAHLTDDVWQDLQDELGSEQCVYRDTGKLSEGTTVSPPRTGPRKGGVTHTPRREHKPKNDGPPPPLLRAMRHMFSWFGEAGIGPTSFKGLHALHLAANETSNIPLQWVQDTDLQRRIRERQRALEEQSRARTEAMKVLRAEQIAEMSPKRGDVGPTTTAELDRMRDQVALDEMERRQKQDEERRSAEEEAAREVAAQRKAERRAAMEARRKEREAKLLELQEMDEDNRDSLLAAERVRVRWEAAKQKAAETGDETILDNY